LTRHYADVYREDQPGFVEMKASLRKLADYAKANHIRIYLAMTPDVHNLKQYQLGFIHDLVKRIAEEDGYQYIDLLPAFGGLSPEQVWAMPGDPHPNALGHELMAKAVAPLLMRENASTIR
jgi:lysophospholipase L1-like esterase